MRTVIAGSRGAKNYDALLAAISVFPGKIKVVLSGTAYGADKLGERWAKENNIPVERYPADWDKYGKRAGYLRNAEMAEKADALIALWDGESKGTKHMIDLAKKAGLLVVVCKHD